jgi:hypothetical protein
VGLLGSSAGILSTAGAQSAIIGGEHYAVASFKKEIEVIFLLSSDVV